MCIRGELRSQRFHVWFDEGLSCCSCLCLCCLLCPWCCPPCCPDLLSLSPACAGPRVPRYPDALLEAADLVGRGVEYAGGWAGVGVLYPYPWTLVLTGYHLEYEVLALRHGHGCRSLPF